MNNLRQRWSPFVSTVAPWRLLATIVAVSLLPVAAWGQIYWADGGGKIQRASLEGSSVTDLVTRWGEEVRRPTGIALDEAGGKMYWTDGSASTIQRANLDGTDLEDLITTGLEQPSGIALDVGAGKMYWTDEGYHARKIQRANLDGSGIEDLVTGVLDEPRGIALDVAGGKMYWVDRWSQKIQRADLDGSGIEDLPVSGLDKPFGIALDVTGGKMYWTDAGADKIQRANLDGTSVEELITSGLENPIGIAVDAVGGKMYWTDSGTYRIQRANLDGTGVEDLIATRLGKRSAIALSFLCGNGSVEGSAEGCDDGGTVARDGCSASCSVEAGWTCAGEPSVCEKVLEHFKCYKAKDLKNPKFAATTVGLSDQFIINDGQFEVKKPFLMCTPVDKNGEGIANDSDQLTCYKIKGPKLDTDDRPEVSAADQFGTVYLEVKKPFLLCVPSAKTVLP